MTEPTGTVSVRYMVDDVARKQGLLQDPSGNVVELFEWTQ